MGRAWRADAGIELARLAGTQALYIWGGELSEKCPAVQMLSDGAGAGAAAVAMRGSSDQSDKGAWGGKARGGNARGPWLASVVDHSLRGLCALAAPIRVRLPQGSLLQLATDLRLSHLMHPQYPGLGVMAYRRHTAGLLVLVAVSRSLARLLQLTSSSQAWILYSFLSRSTP